METPERQSEAAAGTAEAQKPEAKTPDPAPGAEIAEVNDRNRAYATRPGWRAFIGVVVAIGAFALYVTQI